jgi:uncharacterized protein (TIGR02001 family)
MHFRTIPADRVQAAQRFCRLVVVTACAVVSSPALAAGSWGGSIGVTSDYVSRGVTRSAGQPSLLLDGHYIDNSGWFAGASAATVRQTPDSRITAELSGYVGYAQSLTENWSGRWLVAHYAYPGVTPRRAYDYDEVSASLIERDRLFLTVTASPDRGADTTRGLASNRLALAYDLSLRQPLAQGLSAKLGMGYDDLQRLVGTGYIYWNIGLGYDQGPLHLDLAYLGADTTARSLFYDHAAANRLVATLLWSF